MGSTVNEGKLWSDNNQGLFLVGKKCKFSCWIKTTQICLLLSNTRNMEQPMTSPLGQHVGVKNERAYTKCVFFSVSALSCPCYGGGNCQRSLTFSLVINRLSLKKMTMTRICTSLHIERDLGHRLLDYGSQCLVIFARLSTFTKLAFCG